jgi:hypothetical protein
MIQCFFLLILVVFYDGGAGLPLNKKFEYKSIDSVEEFSERSVQEAQLHKVGLA